MVLASLLTPLTTIALWPNPVDQPFQGQLARVLQLLHRHGIPAWLNYNFLEASANVVLFVPLGVIGSLAYPEKSWWRIGCYGLLVSCCMELGQLLFVHSRFSSFIDIVTNVSGTLIGVLLAYVVLTRSAGLPPHVSGPESRR